jgi:hypothetical protein
MFKQVMYEVTTVLRGLRMFTGLHEMYAMKQHEILVANSHFVTVSLP